MEHTSITDKSRCIHLLTEAEDKKYSIAKEKYAHVQKLIAHGSNIRYYNSIPSVIPENYKPTMSLQELPIGDNIRIVENKVEEKTGFHGTKRKRKTVETVVDQQKRIKTKDHSLHGQTSNIMK
jgi:hypothetical protein